MRKILASDVVVPRKTGQPAVDYAEFRKVSSSALKGFVESLILHDAIVIPISQLHDALVVVRCFRGTRAH